MQGKYKKGFKLGKCFVLRDNQISEIRGNFVNDELVVSFQMICFRVIFFGGGIIELNISHKKELMHRITELNIG